MDVIRNDLKKIFTGLKCDEFMFLIYNIYL